MSQTKGIKEFIVFGLITPDTIINTGYEKRPCKTCKRDVLVSPGILQSQRDGLYTGDFICGECAQKRLEKNLTIKEDEEEDEDEIDDD
jgi:hypothetical protein